jgi:hypothetical protein
VKKCFPKFPALKNQDQKATNNNPKQNNGIRKYYKFCQKDVHTEDKCFAIKKQKENLGKAKARISEAQEDNKDQTSTNQILQKTSNRLL